MKPSRSPLERVVQVSFGLDVGGQEKLLVELALRISVSVVKRAINPVP
ncbi:MAG: hypothetical protein ACLQOO_24300 [Terriglobia bacterium]